MSQLSYDRDLDRNAANFQPLTPLTFLERAAAVFPDRIAIAHGPFVAVTASSTPARRSSLRRSPSEALPAATRSR